MPYLEKMALHRIAGANYVTSINGMLHPDRILQEHDFLYMLDGSWEIFEEDTPYEMKSDDLLILTAGRHHYGRSLCNPGNRHMYIHALPTDAEIRLCQKHTLSQTAPVPGAPRAAGGSVPDGMENMERLFFVPTLLHCRPDPRIRQTFHEIITAGWTQSPEQENRLSLLFSLLLCEIAELLTLSPRQPAPDPVVEEVCARVRTTPQTFFSAKEIASGFFICERTLNNRFLKACGKSFYTFQMETKLEMVRQFLLSQPQAKLHEAALNYGFYDEFHLSRAFKKKFGMAPSEYRKRYPEAERAERKEL